MFKDPFQIEETPYDLLGLEPNASSTRTRCSSIFCFSCVAFSRQSFNSVWSALDWRSSAMISASVSCQVMVLWGRLAACAPMASALFEWAAQ